MLSPPAVFSQLFKANKQKNNSIKENIHYLRDAMKSRTSSLSGITRSAPFFVVMREAAAFAKVSSSARFFVSEILKTVFQHIIQGACTEGVSCTGGFNGFS